MNDNITAGKTSLTWGLVISTLIVFFNPIRTWGYTSKLELEASMNGGYESNIYHSFADSSKQSTLLNVYTADLTWKRKTSRTYRHRATVYLDIDYYPSYTSRNRSSYGVKFEPTLRYNHDGRFEAGVDVSRRNKDLIDDNGLILSRTLKRWNFDYFASHRYDFSHVRLEQGISYTALNYDEVVGLLSYDYHAWIPFFKVRAELTPAWTAIAIYTAEKRYYRERKTYTVQYGAFVGRPFAVRDFWEHKVELSLNYEFSKKNDVTAEVEFARRDENFENFYGFSHWQYRLKFDFQPFNHDRTVLSFRFKNKDYENYWTSRIGLLNRVSVDYADLQLENSIEISPSFSIQLFLQNYNKVSNDQFFDYTDFTVSSGVSFKY